MFGTGYSPINPYGGVVPNVQPGVPFQRPELPQQKPTTPVIPGRDSPERGSYGWQREFLSN